MRILFIGNKEKSISAFNKFRGTVLLDAKQAQTIWWKSL